MVYIIYSSSYDPASGGNSITHHLCHYINKALGNGNAYLCPPVQKGLGDFDFFNNSDTIIKKLEDYDETKISNFKTNPQLNTPVVTREILITRNNTAIYTEGIYGNPLEQKNVVRWILFFAPPEFVKTWSKTDMFVFYSYCYYNTYNFFYKTQDYLTSMIKNPFVLTILNHKTLFRDYTPWEEREGTCYTLRKGSKGFYFPIRGDKNCNLKYIHNITKSFHFEYESQLSDVELLELFNRTRIFYAYDPFTFQSLQAALCGCVSIVAPIEGLSKEKLFENVPHMQYGVAYGIEDYEHALNTMHLVGNHLTEYAKKNLDRVSEFCRNAEVFFETNKISQITESETKILNAIDRAFLSTNPDLAFDFLFELLSPGYQKSCGSYFEELQLICGGYSEEFLKKLRIPEIKTSTLKYPIQESRKERGLLDGWVNFEQAARDARLWSPMISEDIEAIIFTCPFSQFVASILSLHKNIPIITEQDSNKYNKILVLTDGTKIINLSKTNMVSGSLYVSDEIELWIDLRYKIIPKGIQEWNFRFNEEFWINSMVDFDGVLSVDPENHYFSSPEDVREFHLSVKKYMAPFVKIGCITTGRRIRFLDSSQGWLQKHNVNVEEMRLNPASVQDLSLHPNFKSEEFKNSSYQYFVESDIEQSIAISKVGKPVLCIDNMQVYII